MLFFSQCIGARIASSSGESRGVVSDISVSFEREATPVVTGIVAKERGKCSFIPLSAVETLGPAAVTLNTAKSFKPFTPERSDALLLRDVLDKQIFDIDSVRVVRVNDIQLAKIKQEFCMVAVDVSPYALLVRLGIPELLYRPFLARRLIEWEDMTLVKEGDKKLKLKTSYEKLKQLHPADIANLIEHLSLEESTKVLGSLDTETVADVIAEVEPKYKDILLESIPNKELSETLEELPSDEAADILQDLSEAKRREVLAEMTPARARELTLLSSYGHGTAGSLMTTEFMLLAQDTTVEEALAKVRKDEDDYTSLYHVFVKNTRGHLIGVASLRTLVCSKRGDELSDICSPIAVTIPPDMPLKEVAKVLTKYNLMSVAVVTNDKMIGMVTVDDIMRTLIPHA